MIPFSYLRGLPGLLWKSTHHRDPTRQGRNRNSEYLAQRRQGRKGRRITVNNFSKIIHLSLPNLAYFAPWRESIPLFEYFSSTENLRRRRKFSRKIVQSLQKVYLRRYLHSIFSAPPRLATRELKDLFKKQFLILLSLVRKTLGVEIVRFHRLYFVGVRKRRVDAFAVDELTHPGQDSHAFIAEEKIDERLSAIRALSFVAQRQILANAQHLAEPDPIHRRAF